MKERFIDLQLIKPVTPGSSGAKGKTSLKKLFAEYLEKLNIPFFDPCCPENSQGNSPLRYNTETETLQFLNGDTNQWEDTASLGAAEEMDVFLIAGQSNARGVGTRTSSPNPSAILDLQSTTKGFLPPRMTAAQAGTLTSSLTTAEEGMMIYVTDTDSTFTTKGWWGWNGASWEQLNN